MTRKTFPLMILIGAVLVAGTFAGCGPRKPTRAEVLQRKVDNLEGQLYRLDQQLAASGALSADLSDARREIQDKDVEIDELRRQLAIKPPDITPSRGAPEVITVSDGVLFKFAAADLSSAGKRKLDAVAADIKRRYPGQKISVEGHTDSVRLAKPATVAKYGRNVWLSAHRAWAVADYLIKRGISEKLVSVVGRGYSMPTGRGADRDRRVEIIILAR